MEIKKVVAREILDSRGNPTVEARVYLTDGTVGVGAVPSGASTGSFEALELRDKDPDRYVGKGVTKAVNNINAVLSEVITGMDPGDIYGVDNAMCLADGTEDKSCLGANAILAVSIANARAAAASLGIPLYRFLGGCVGNTLPIPMMNILNGGAHASNNLDVQEFMIVPVGAVDFKEALRNCAEVYHALKALLHSRGLSTSVGDEGGFAPDLAGVEEAMVLIMEAVERAGFRPGEDFMLALDAAASEWKGTALGHYRQPKSGKTFSASELTQYWEKLVDHYPVLSIEDGLDEEDWEGWQQMTASLGGRVRLVGDDLFVTNSKRLARGMQHGCANSILIKMNQIGTLSETLEVIMMARQGGFCPIVSHRSGETGDTTMADLAVATGCPFIKSGAPARYERVAKYNRLLRIQEELNL